VPALEALARSVQQRNWARSECTKSLLCGEVLSNDAAEEQWRSSTLKFESVTLNAFLEAKLTAEPRAFYIDTRNLTCYFSNWLDGFA
jgi:hypothetical protein